MLLFPQIQIPDTIVWQLLDIDSINGNYSKLLEFNLEDSLYFRNVVSLRLKDIVPDLSKRHALEGAILFCIFFMQLSNQVHEKIQSIQEKHRSTADDSSVW